MPDVQFLTITTTAVKTICDASGNAIVTGVFAAYATDQYDRPIAFTSGGVNQAMKKTVTAPIVNGQISGTFKLANPAVTTPVGIQYHVTITDSTTGSVTHYPGVSISVASGVSTWDWSAWNPALGVVSIPTNLITGPAGPTGPTGPTGATGPQGATAITGMTGDGAGNATLTGTFTAAKFVTSIFTDLAATLKMLADRINPNSYDITKLEVFTDAADNIHAFADAFDAFWTFNGIKNTPLDRLAFAAGGSIEVRESYDAAPDPFYDVDATEQIVASTSLSLSSPTEVITARGTAADLNTRLSRALTAAGSLRTAIENIGRLYGLRAAIEWIKLGNAALIHLLMDGDSWFDGHSYGTKDGINRFLADSGLTLAGPGWIGLASSTQGGSPHGDALDRITVTRDVNWTDLFVSAGTVGSVQNFPGYDACSASAPNAIITLAGADLASATALTLYCGKGGSFSYSWDGGTTWTALTVAAGSGSTTSTIGLTGKTSTLKIRADLSGGVAAGVLCQTAASGVLFSNLASSGSTAQQHASVQANADYQAMMATLPGAVRVILMELGANDSKLGTGASAIQGYIGTVLAGYRALFPGCGGVFLALPDLALSVGCELDAVSVLMRAYTEDNDWAFFDFQNVFGPISVGTTYSAYANGSSRSLLESTNRHPSTGSVLCGANLVSLAFYNLLMSPLRLN